MGIAVLSRGHSYGVTTFKLSLPLWFASARFNNRTRMPPQSSHSRITPSLDGYHVRSISFAPSDGC
jgi:hypothetical protein